MYHYVIINVAEISCTRPLGGTEHVFKKKSDHTDHVISEFTALSVIFLILKLISKNIPHRDFLKIIFFDQKSFSDHLISEFEAWSVIFPILRLVSENITHRDFSKIIFPIKNSISVILSVNFRLFH